MRIRHLVSAENVDPTGFVIDPRLARHGMVVGGAIAELAGPVERLTHLNLDFPPHRLDECLVAERLEVGARLLRDDDRFQIASVRPNAYARLGPVDLDARRLAWQRVGVGETRSADRRGDLEDRREHRR
jgi:hypothetical protein